MTQNNQKSTPVTSNDKPMTATELRAYCSSSTSGTTEDGTRHIEKDCHKRSSMKLVLPGGVQWNFIHAKDGKPEYFVGKSHGITVHLKKGLRPRDLTDNGEYVVEIKEREVAAKKLGGPSQKYMYLNVYPKPERAESTTFTVVIMGADPTVESNSVKFAWGNNTRTIPGAIERKWHRLADRCGAGLDGRPTVEGTIVLIKG